MLQFQLSMDGLTIYDCIMSFRKLFHNTNDKMVGDFQGRLHHSIFRDRTLGMRYDKHNNSIDEKYTAIKKGSPTNT